MHSNLMTTHILLLQGARERYNPRAHNEECRSKLLLIQIRQQVRGIECRSVIICQSPVHGCGALSDISRPGASSASPPASRRVVDGFSVVWASAYTDVRKSFERLTVLKMTNQGWLPRYQELQHRCLRHPVSTAAPPENPQGVGCQGGGSSSVTKGQLYVE